MLVGEDFFHACLAAAHDERLVFEEASDAGAAERAAALLAFEFRYRVAAEVFHRHLHIRQPCHGSPVLLEPRGKRLFLRARLFLPSRVYGNARRLCCFLRAVDNPGSGNAAKDLSLELVRHLALG